MVRRRWINGLRSSKIVNLNQDNNPDSVIIGSRFVKGGGYKGIEVTGQTNFLKQCIIFQNLMILC